MKRNVVLLLREGRAVGSSTVAMLTVLDVQYTALQSCRQMLAMELELDPEQVNVRVKLVGPPSSERLVPVYSLPPGVEETSARQAINRVNFAMDAVWRRLRRSIQERRA